MRSASRRAGARSPEKDASTIPRERASLTISGRSQPEMCRSVAYLRRASAKEPPIRPVPRMVAREMRWGDIELADNRLRTVEGRRKDNAETQRAQRFAEKGGQPEMGVPLIPQ